MAKPKLTNPDMFSQLPDEIVSHICSFLPTVDAVRATVLSKKFDGLWKKLTVVDFDSEREFQDYYPQRFQSFVSRVLLYSSGSETPTFRLKLYGNRYKYFVGDWISAAVRRKVVELDLHLNFETGVDFVLPLDIFWCKTLEVLKLNLTKWEIIGDIPKQSWFPSLKFLHVTLTTFADLEELGKLLFYFPVLEELILDGISQEDGTGFETDTYSILVDAKKLKTARICVDSIIEPVDIHLDAPKLQSIDFEQRGLTRCYLDGTPEFLINANIAFGAKAEPEHPNYSAELLNQVKLVKSLSVSAHCLEHLRLPQDWHPPVFWKLNQLRLAFGDQNLLAVLGVFLNSAPALEDLVLEDRTKASTERHWNPPEEVPTGLSSSLKTISVKGFKGRPFDMEMVKYLFKNGRLLNKMTISTSLRLSSAKLEELRICDKAATCHFVVLQG